jgi:RNA polymerase sigma-70 factor, ECF subfamily
MNLSAPVIGGDDEATRLALARAQAGDAGAFARLYRDHHRKIYALCLRLTADRGAAEELTQDTFVKAWQRLDSFRGEARFSTWLHRIAVNTAISHRRKRAWLSLRPAFDDEVPADLAPPPGLMRDLDRAIARLPPRARHVFVLIDVEGFSHEEAASTLGMAVGTSKAHLHRARELLRGMLT